MSRPIADADTARTRAVFLGTVGVAVITAVTFVLPLLLPLSAIKESVRSWLGVWLFGNPFLNLRLLGGFLGAVVTGYFGPRHDAFESAMFDGARSAAYGLSLVFLGYVLYSMANAAIVHGIVPPPFYVAFVVPLIFVVGLFPAFLIGGLFGGLLGTFLRRLVESPGTI